MAKHLIGIGLIVLAMFFFASTYAFYKACSFSLTDTQTLFFQNLFSWIFILPFVLAKGKKLLKTDRLLWIVVRTAVGMVSIYCIAKALETVTLAEVTLLNSAAPLFVPFIVWLWYRIKIKLSLWGAIILGFIGIYLVLQPGLTGINTGLLFALISGIAAGLLLVVMKQVAHEPLLRVLFYYFLLFCIVMGPLAFIDWRTPPLEIWLFLLCSGLTMIAAQLTFTAALRYVSSHEIAPFVYTGVIFGGLIDWLVWNTVPNMLSILGMVIVSVGCTLSVFIRTRKES